MIIFDLDGPLIDVSEKYYRLHFDLFHEKKLQPLLKMDYWEKKRNKIPESEILKEAGGGRMYGWYQEKRLDLIETDEYLKYDYLQDGAKDMLERLAGKYDLVLVTLRRNREQLKKEMRSLGIIKFFTLILNAPADTSPKWKIKYDLIRQNVKTSKNIIAFIGDTETDVICARKLEMRSIAVQNGIRSQKLLQDLAPDEIINGIQDLKIKPE